MFRISYLGFRVLAIRLSHPSLGLTDIMAQIRRGHMADQETERFTGEVSPKVQDAYDKAARLSALLLSGEKWDVAIKELNIQPDQLPQIKAFLGKD